jgi:hypothetical protein
MIPQKTHTVFELKACTIKLQKISEAYIAIEHEYWLYNTIDSTNAEIQLLQQQLGIIAKPFTALQYLKRL